ncbi:hypothetical protein AAFG07_25970 [Bradyrhizobium sp. B097]|uniref:hypothetical protein n=1 Tax=Bradyrhizobium sp. B097 TaxID=3140244 RepID=UPI00318425ED
MTDERRAAKAMYVSFWPKGDIGQEAADGRDGPQPDINRTMAKSWSLVGGHSLMNFFALR